MESNPYNNQEATTSPLENNDTLHLESIKDNKFVVAQNGNHADYMAERILVDVLNTLKNEVEFQEIIRRSYEEKVAKLMSATLNTNNIEISISFENKAGSEVFDFSHSYNISRELFEAYVLVISNNINARERFKKSTPVATNKKYTVRGGNNA